MDLTQIIVALLVALPATIAALGTFVVSLRSGRRADAARISAALAAARAEESKAILVQTQDGIFELGKQLDGRLSELLRSTGETEHAAGRREGVESEQTRMSPASAAPPA